MRHFRLICILLISLTSLGCRMAAPMMVWEPSAYRARTISSIAMAPIMGDQALAAKLNEAMIENQPKSGYPIAFLHPKMLEEITNIQLAGYDGQPSDIAGLSAARRANADVMLQGEIIQAKTQSQEPKKGKLDFRVRPSEEMAVSWTLTDVTTGERVASHLTKLDRVTAERLYPDVLAQPGEPMNRLVHGVARESWMFLVPKTKAEDTTLVLPWLMPGASKIRHGNAMAKQGRWDLAEEKWQDAASKYSWSDAAWHNLALSAVAREDFELARRRLNHAKTILPNDRADKTERWIDEKQHDYHRALGLPDREGGWLVPDPPPRLELEEIPSSEPRDIDELPWWTAIPGMKPPGWTWGKWLTQPWVF
jgi:hypothetical protein